MIKNHTKAKRKFPGDLPRPLLRRALSRKTITLHFDVDPRDKETRKKKFAQLMASKTELCRFLKDAVQKWLDEHVEDFTVQLTDRGL